MEASTRQKIQIVMVLLIVVAGIRVGWIFYERHQEAAAPEKKEAPPLNPDYYVTPKKVYAYDLKTAKRELANQAAWVKVGYYYPYYPYQSSTRHVDLAHDTRKLQPLERLEIKDVVRAPAPGKPGTQDILAVFQKDGKSYAAPVGREQSGDYKFYANDMLFFEDPHQLYRHWSPDIWQAIDQRQAKPGMSELQVDFAIGIGLLEQGGDETVKTLEYPNGGLPLSVSYHNGKAIEIRPEAAK